MIQIAAEMNRGLEDELKNFSRSFAEASSKTADLEQQWQRPVNQSSARTPETCYVGKWKGNNFLNGYNAEEFPKLQEKYNPGRHHIKQRNDAAPIYAGNTVSA